MEENQPSMTMTRKSNAGMPLHFLVFAILLILLWGRVFLGKFKEGRVKERTERMSRTLENQSILVIYIG